MVPTDPLPWALSVPSERNRTPQKCTQVQSPGKTRGMVKADLSWNPSVSQTHLRIRVYISQNTLYLDMGIPLLIYLLKNA